MKKILSFCFLFCLTSLLSGQTVDSIKVEQIGDMIKIYFKLSNSTESEVFKLTVLCSINGGLKSELKSLSGDVGENVVGGRQEYTVLWDVLKDVDELKSAEFFVRAELIKDYTKTNTSAGEDFSKRKTYIMALMAVDGTESLYGARFAYMGPWGISAKFLVGKRFDPKYYLSISTGLNLTRRIVKGPGFKVHLLAGCTVMKLSTRGKEYQITTTYGTSTGTVFQTDNLLTWNGGFVFTSKRVAIFTGLSIFKVNKVSGENRFPELGLGYTF